MNPISQFLFLIQEDDMEICVTSPDAGYLRECFDRAGLQSILKESFDSLIARTDTKVYVDFSVPNNTLYFSIEDEEGNIWSYPVPISEDENEQLKMLWDMTEEAQNRFDILEESFNMDCNVREQFFIQGGAMKSEEQRTGRGDDSEISVILADLTHEEMQIKQQVEVLTGGIVYHVIVSNTDAGKLYSFLYVSKHCHEWEDEKNVLGFGCPTVARYHADTNTVSAVAVDILASHGGLCILK